MNHTLETKEAHLLYSYLSRCKTSIPKTVLPFLSFFFNRERKSNSNSFNNISSYSVLFITQSHVSHAHTECRLNPNSNLSYRLWPANYTVFIPDTSFLPKIITRTQSDTYR